MPGFTTHYLFGVNAYHSMKNDTIKKNIFDHHAAFSLGLQGPDIFFYFLPSYFIHGKNIGSIAHNEATGKFLSNLIESRNLFPDKEEAAIAQAYIMGFLGHYILDCRCHPYIYWRTHYREDNPAYYGDHMNLETDIDTELLSFYKKKRPSAFRKESTILLTRPELRTITTILYYVYAVTYPEQTVNCTIMRLAIRSMQLGTWLLHDRRGQKKALFRKLEAVTTGYPVLSPMVASDYLQFYADPLNLLHRQWRNPWNENLVSQDSFFDLMDMAQKEYTELLPRLYRLFLTKKHSDAAKLRLIKILDSLGNQSYHSGLEL